MPFDKLQSRLLKSSERRKIKNWEKVVFRDLIIKHYERKNLLLIPDRILLFGNLGISTKKWPPRKGNTFANIPRPKKCFSVPHIG